MIGAQKEEADLNGSLAAASTDPVAASEVEISTDIHDSTITCPLVLQCSQCRTIVGDSCSIVDLNGSWRTMTITRKALPFNLMVY